MALFQYGIERSFNLKLSLFPEPVVFAFHVTVSKYFNVQSTMAYIQSVLVISKRRGLRMYQSQVISYSIENGMLDKITDLRNSYWFVIQRSAQYHLYKAFDEKHPNSLYFT